jgi:hypothetical protein
MKRNAEIGFYEAINKKRQGYRDPCLSELASPGAVGFWR